MLKFEFIILPEETLEVKNYLEQNWLDPNAPAIQKVFYYIFKTLSFPVMAFQHWKFLKELNRKTQAQIKTNLSIDDSGIISRGGVVESESDWSEISKAGETAKTFYFCSIRAKPETSYLYILPKRAIKNDELIILNTLIEENFEK